MFHKVLELSFRKIPGAPAAHKKAPEVKPGRGNLYVRYPSGTRAAAVTLTLENSEEFFAAGLLIAFIPFLVFLLFTKNPHLRFDGSRIE